MKIFRENKSDNKSLKMTTESISDNLKDLRGQIQTKSSRFVIKKSNISNHEKRRNSEEKLLLASSVSNSISPDLSSVMSSSMSPSPGCINKDAYRRNTECTDISVKVSAFIKTKFI